MARLQFSSVGELKAPQNPMTPESMVEKTLAETRLNEGMITALDPADINTGSLTVCRNARVRFDRTLRRPGSNLLTPTKPNSNAVIGLYYYKSNSGSVAFFRATKSSLHNLSGGTWNAITGTLSGTDADYFQFVTAFNRVFFVNNGVQPVHEINIGAGTHATLNVSEATVPTQYRFLTAFYNRLVGAHLLGSVPDPTRIGWSSDAGITGTGLEEWNPSVNETSGFSPLVDSPGDLADYISGIFGLTNVLLVLREQSIWLGTKNPVPSQPFNFYTAYPGIGCDCPFSASLILNGVAWLDTRTKTVWAYAPNSTPEPISRSIENELLRAIDDPEKVFGGYNFIENEYSVGIPASSSALMRIWTYNFRTKAWVYDEYEAISKIADLPIAISGLTIDELIGTIEGLTGTINSLGPSSSTPVTRLYGRTDGEIIQEDYNFNTDTDPVVSGSTLGSQSGVITMTLVSKDYELPEVDAYFSRVTIKLRARRSGTVVLSYSKDNRDWVVAKSKTFTPAEVATSSNERTGMSCFIRFHKNLHCRRLNWRLTADSGDFDIEWYEIKYYPAGVYRK